LVAILWQLNGCYLLEALMAFPDRIERTIGAQKLAELAVDAA
jgi:hypothetical protein